VRCDARHNRIVNFPELTGRESQSLSELFLGFNQLTQMSDSVGALKAITVLDLGDNKLKVLPVLQSSSV